MKDIVSPFFYLDGSIYPTTDVKPVCLQNDIYYEVIRVMESVPVFLADHLERLEASLRNDRKTSALAGSIKNGIKLFLEKNPLKNGNLKVMVCFDKSPDEYSIVIYQSAHSYPAKELYEKGIVLKCSEMQRLNPTVKKWNQQLKQRVAVMKAEEQVYEVLLTDSEGNITEGSRSNIFFISDEKLITAPGHLVLPGITRQKVIDICGDLGVEVACKTVSCSDFSGVQGAFLTGTSPKVLPVSRIGQSRFSVNHKLMKDIIKEYDKLLAREIAQNK